MHTRPIPATGEPLPVIGCGTYKGFDVAPGSATYAQLPGVLDALFTAGGSVLDSSPMYGRAEATVGELLAHPESTAIPSLRFAPASPIRGRSILGRPCGAEPRAFLATKVWTRGRDAGIDQMQRSMTLMKADRLDLMQIHNLVDWKLHLRTLRDWKEVGRIRYLGVTHYTSSAYADLEAVLRAEPLDFVQINYSIADRAAEKRLLPLAAERGIAVLANLPLGSGSVLRSVQGLPLPGWAAGLACTSWSQLFLKFVISHPAVTCAIPGTGQAAHMADNAQAGTGPMPDEAQRRRIAQWWEQERG